MHEKLHEKESKKEAKRKKAIVSRSQHRHGDNNGAK